VRLIGGSVLSMLHHGPNQLALRGFYGIGNGETELIVKTDRGLQVVYKDIRRYFFQLHVSFDL
jgi:hypothetical protein